MNEFDQLLEKEIPRLRRYAFALTGNMSRADDPRFRIPSSAQLRRSVAGSGVPSFAPWLCIIMHHQNADIVRHSAREGSAITVDDAWPFPIAPIDPTAALSLRDLDRALARISEEQRQVILLIGLEGTSYEEAATILDVPIGTIRSRLSRGRTSLRTLMDRGDGTEATNGAAITRAANRTEVPTLRPGS